MEAKQVFEQSDKQLTPNWPQCLLQKSGHSDSSQTFAREHAIKSDKTKTCNRQSRGCFTLSFKSVMTICCVFIDDLGRLEAHQ